MTFQNKDLFFEKFNLMLFLVFIFHIPMMTEFKALTPIIAFLILTSIIWQGDYSSYYERLKSNPLFWMFLFYTILFPLSLFWTNNMEWGWFVVERQVKILIFFPLLLLIVKEKHTSFYISAFIAGVSVTEVISYLVWFEVIHIEGVSSYNPTPFFSHIHYNPMLAFAIYLLGHTLLFNNSIKTNQKICVAFFISTMVINMLITGGRNGQVLFFILTSVLIVQYSISKKMLFKGLAFLIFILVGVFSTAYHNSNLFKERFDLAVVEVKNYSPSSHTSVGLRLQFWENTLYMSLNRPISEILFGSSPGDFPEKYTASLRDSKSYKMKPDRLVLNHPHSQYFYQLGALGIVGLLSLLLLVFSILYYALNIKDNYRYQRFAFAVFFIVVLVPNAQLLSKGTSHMIIALSVVYFSSLIFKKTHGLRLEK